MLPKIRNRLITKVHPKKKSSQNQKADLECGVFHKRERKKCFAYAAQTACNKNGYGNLVSENARVAQDQKEYQKRCNSLVQRHESTKN